MQGLTRRWLIRDDAPEAASVACATPHRSALLMRLLTARGLCDQESIDRFCEPKLTDLHDPGLMPNIDRAVERIVHALRRDEQIVIYGDYDVDGITATAILYHIIKTAMPKARLRTYIPHRLEEGYGLNVEAMRQLRADGADLVISVDCGITAVEPARVARDIGLDLIITDHHNPPPPDSSIDKSNPGLPDAILVHPRVMEDGWVSANKSDGSGSDVIRGGYPFPELCGAGVAFKVAWRFATCWCNSERVSESFQQKLLEMLPLVALGTIADVVPLVGENRVLTSFGLRLIKRTNLPGLRALIEASDLMGESIDCHKVGFILGPRLNACGRMGHAVEAVRMLTDAPADEAQMIARQLTQFNRERQQTERTILDQAIARAEDAGMTGNDRRVIVLAHPDWHPGVVGIVCSRLVDRFGRPAVLMQHQGTMCKGSARSIDGYSIHAGLSACAAHLSTFGGHDAAAGLSLDFATLDAFTEALTAHANAHIGEAELTPAIAIDCDAALHEFDRLTVERIAHLAPFGRGNRRPTIRVRGAALAEAPRQIGREGKHLSLRIRQDKDGKRQTIRCVWWGTGSLASDLAAGMQLDLALEPKLDHYAGRTTVEAEIRDLRICETAASGSAVVQIAQSGAPAVSES